MNKRGADNIIKSRGNSHTKCTVQKYQTKLRKKHQKVQQQYQRSAISGADVKIASLIKN